MSLKFFTDENQVREFGRGLGAPKQSLAKGTYNHKASGNNVFYLALANGRPDSDTMGALAKLIEVQGLDTIVSALNSGLSLAAGCKGRELWTPGKPGSAKADRSID